MRPVRKINVIGKRGTGEPFKIPKHKGGYLYILAKDAEKLLKINEAYRTLRRGGARLKPLEEVKFVGRRGIVGFRPFLFAGERYLCINSEQLERLGEVNEAYRELSRKKRAKAKA